MPEFQLVMIMADGARVVDEDPYDCTGDAEVIAEAQRAAVEIAGDALAAGKRPTVRSIEVFTMGGDTHLATIQVSAAVAAMLA